MKNLFLQKLGLLWTLTLFCCATLMAQAQRDVVIVKKITTKDGSTQHPGDVTLIEYQREGDAPFAKVVWKGENGNHHYNWNPGRHFSNHRNPCKVFIGVGTKSVPGGLEVDYTVDNTPASTYGVEAGDIILALDGVPVKTQSELERERDKHQQGEAFTLTILRSGSEMKINARFKECSDEEIKQYEEQQEAMELKMEEAMERMQQHTFAKEALKSEWKERPILGVYENTEVNEQGLVISSVVPGKGAEAAGLQGGDVVVKVDGETVTGGGTLRTALIGHQAGDRVTVIYLRDGQTLETEVALSPGQSFYSYKAERDPCAVFIGVYTGDRGHDGRGVQVTGVVDDTPAKQSDVQPGDVIIALDGQPVNDHIELLRERNKHRPGDPFRLTVVRDGAYMDIDAVFKACPKPGESVAPEKEVVTLMESDQAAEQREKTGVALELLEAYPSPTVGPLNVRFEAEAVPTTVRIMDVSGKLVYNNVLNQFNGSFNEQINLYGNAPGAYTLTVQQGNKVSSKKIVLLPRA